MARVYKKRLERKIESLWIKFQMPQEIVKAVLFYYAKQFF